MPFLIDPKSCTYVSFIMLRSQRFRYKISKDVLCPLSLVQKSLNHHISVQLSYRHNIMDNRYSLHHDLNTSSVYQDGRNGGTDVASWCELKPRRGSQLTRKTWSTVVLREHESNLINVLISISWFMSRYARLEHMDIYIFFLQIHIHIKNVCTLYKMYK